MSRTAAPLALLVALMAAAPATASLPHVESGHRPGPDALYAAPAEAPQLQNTGPWTAEPILVSGAAAYRDGEFLYQDFLLDDRGAMGTRDMEDPRGPNDYLYSPTAGTLTYPRNQAVYANNAADLVELRVKPLADATAFRVTLNTLIDPRRTAFTIALGDSGEVRQWPHGAGVRSPAERFLTVHGAVAELRDAAGGAPLTPAPAAEVDLARRQIEVRVPHAAWNPGESTVRMTIGVGLWDPDAGRYLAPRAGDATAEQPGGGRPSGAALFNVGPRFDEPMPEIGTGAGATMADAAVGSAVQAAWWRERRQADALALGDVSGFAAHVDFARLKAGRDDDSGVPRSGPINRILASRHSFGQGIDNSLVCFDIGAGYSAGASCKGRFVGQLQAYALYVPDRPPPDAGFGLTLLLHSLSANYNQYSASRNQSQFGERGAGTLVATPGGRGPDGFYAGIAEADTFEVWADVARHYDLDPEWAAVGGYSMGGYGTFRLLARWPDLFARGMSTVGVPGTADDQLASLRNTPIMTWAAAADELVTITETEEATRRMTEEGLRFEHFLFEAADHLTLATNDEYGPAAAFLGEHRVDRDPPHVTYVVDPAEDSAEAQAVGDHAYWLSGLTVADPGAAPRGTIDARSEAFGVGDPPVQGVKRSAGVLEGGSRGPTPYDHREQAWGPAPSTPQADRLVVTATNVGTATVDAARARLSCSPTLDVTADRPLDLVIDCGDVLQAGSAPCGQGVSLALPRVAGARVVAARATRSGRTVGRARGRALRRIAVRRPGRGAFAVRVRAETVGADGLDSVTVTRRVAACA